MLVGNQPLQAKCVLNVPVVSLFGSLCFVVGSSCPVLIHCSRILRYVGRNISGLTNYLPVLNDETDFDHLDLT